MLMRRMRWLKKRQAAMKPADALARPVARSMVMMSFMGIVD
jgi:hypothetical protein